MTDWEKQVIATVKATMEKKKANGDTMSVWPAVKPEWNFVKEVNPELEAYELDEV